MRRAKFLGLVVVWVVGQHIKESAGDSWAVYALGGVLMVGALATIFRLIYLDGFRDGIDSVPLVGVGLASGDDRAFDPGHRWNADLGAWEKRP